MEKRWLTLKEAAKYSSIGLNRLQKMAQSGEVRACQDENDGRRRWIFDRESLDLYYMVQMSGPSRREKVLAVLKDIHL